MKNYSEKKENAKVVKSILRHSKNIGLGTLGYSAGVLLEMVGGPMKFVGTKITNAGENVFEAGLDKLEDSVRELIIK